MSNNSYSKDWQSISDIIQSTYKSKHVPHNTNILTGFHPIDELTHGLQIGQLTAIIGRPHMGKTDFVLSMMRNIAFRYNLPTLYYNPMMVPESFLYRVLANDINIPFKKIWNNELDLNESETLIGSMDKWEDKKIFLELDEKLTIEDICYRTEEGSKNNGIKLLFVDYVQLINSPQNETDEDLLPIILKFKNLARKLNIAIVLVSRYNPTSENIAIFEGKRPLLYEIKEIGSIGMADMLFVLHRPDFYDSKCKQNGNKLNENVNIYIATQDSEQVEECTLSYNEESGRIDNY